MYKSLTIKQLLLKKQINLDQLSKVHFFLFIHFCNFLT